MKILVVCQYYYPENFQITPICEELVKKGHSVTVLTGLPNYPEGIVPDIYKKGHRDEYINDVHVIRTYEIGRGKGTVKLALNYLSFLVSATFKSFCLKEKYDVVLVYQLSPITMAIPGYVYAKKNKKPLVHYCCDIWPESLKVYIKNEDNVLFKCVNYISKKIYESADLVICQSKSFMEYMSNHHKIDIKKCVHIPAFGDDNLLSINKHIENDVVDYVFMGNIGKAQIIDSVIEALSNVKSSVRCCLHLVGDGSDVDRIKEYVKNHNLDNMVKFYGRKNSDELIDFYQLADYCVVSLSDDSKIGLTLPTKVQGYMAAGKAIFAVIKGDAADLIKETGCGYCCSSENMKAIINCFKKSIDELSNIQEMGKKSRDYYVSHFKKDLVIEEIENQLKYVLNKN